MHHSRPINNHTRNVILVLLLIVVTTLFSSTTCRQTIAGGVEAKLGQFPYAIGIRLRDDTVPIPFCGGGLISPYHVLTAAHCVYDDDEQNPSILDPYDFEIILGTVDANNKSQGIISYVQDIIVHGDYDPNTFENDIALLVLEQNVTLTEYIDIVQLYNKSVVEKMMFTAVGWGYTDAKSEEEDNAPSVMRTVTVPVDNNVCQTDVYEHQFCGGTGKGQDTCGGDSGGIVTINEDGVWKAIGVVSNGDTPCGGNGVAGVYTTIPDFLDWIEYAQQGGSASSLTHSITLLVVTAFVLSFNFFMYS
jgi:secreted trypsin-like serine protease